MHTSIFLVCNNKQEMPSSLVQYLLGNDGDHTASVVGVAVLLQASSYRWKWHGIVEFNIPLDTV